MADTSEQKYDRARMIQDAIGDNPKCVVCQRSTRHLDGAVFCSPGCESKAMSYQGGTIAQQQMQQFARPNKFYMSQARLLDGGMWKGQTKKAKARKIARDWKGQF